LAEVREARTKVEMVEMAEVAEMVEMVVVVVYRHDIVEVLGLELEGLRNSRLARPQGRRCMVLGVEGLIAGWGSRRQRWRALGGWNMCSGAGDLFGVAELDIAWEEGYLFGEVRVYCLKEYGGLGPSEDIVAFHQLVEVVDLVEQHRMVQVHCVEDSYWEEMIVADMVALLDLVYYLSLGKFETNLAEARSIFQDLVGVVLLEEGTNNLVVLVGLD
jgi:hypothetical protein